MIHFVRRVVPGVLSAGALAAALAGCGSDGLTSAGGGDRVVPTVSLSVDGVNGSPSKTDSVNVREALGLSINASDNSSIQSVVIGIVIDGVVLRSDSVAYTNGLTSVTRTASMNLGGVRTGQTVVIRATAYDAGGNKGTAEVSATAYDPTVPRVLILSPDLAVIGGGTYTFRVQGMDTIGVTKLGYRSTGPSALTRSDSLLLSVPYPRNDTTVFSFTVPASVPVGTQFTIEPFAQNRDGLGSVGDKATVTVVAAGVDNNTPLAYQSVPARMETGDSLDIIGRDSDGLLKAIGYIVKDSSGAQVASVDIPIATPARQVIRRVEWNVPITLRGRGLFVVAYAVDQANHKGYAVASGTNVPVSNEAEGRQDPTVYAFGLTTALPAGSLGADIAVDNGSGRSRVYVSNMTKNELEAFDYSVGAISKLPPVSVGAQPWGMVIDNSGSFLLVANSGGTNISRVDLGSRSETGRIKTANAYIYNVAWSKDLSRDRKSVV